jgi:hypothetical protein
MVSVQQYVMLSSLTGFEERTNASNRIREPFVAYMSSKGDRWLITAWQSCQRGWAIPPYPCIHSDPAFPEIPPGEMRSLFGWVSFYEGTRIEEEPRRIGSTPLFAP